MIAISVQARMGSTRLPGKVLLELGDRRVIEHVVERASAVSMVTDTVLTTGDRDPNEAIREWCRRSDVSCETGPEENLLERHRQVAAATDADTLVRLTGDCPFVPASEIDRVIEAHQTNDARYTTNVTEDMPLGTAVDVIDTTVLDELSELGATHPVKRPRKNPEHWEMATTTVNEWTRYGEVDIAVDTPNDYWTLYDAVKTVGEDPRAVTRFLADRDNER
jgi:spore coat polysaccharide biosynthesis protein SpsF